MTCIHCACDECRAAFASRSDRGAWALELRAQGLTLPRIAEVIGSTQSGVCKLLKKERNRQALNPAAEVNRM